MSHQNEALVLIEVGSSTTILHADSYKAMQHNAIGIKKAHLAAYANLAKRVINESNLDMDSSQICLSHSVCFVDSPPDEAQQIHRSWLVTIQAHIRYTKTY